ncbi:Lrp/AsnC ligand binding domain-containing protein [Streptacidiphilus albus]|uniref:Lrp/AsnC ligand binding domain-containing protein n=1 Tax=Streptacidiphilus albus TaxID=105425 RepID=UPI0006918D3E|nr:Lrp/AsnC ligand binding domain-containing protein [Streptacidiphilus albus]
MADALAGHAEVAYAAATTGPGNLAAMVVRRDADALYEYLARRLGGRQGVLSAEATPVTRHIKRSGALLGPVRSV